MTTVALLPGAAMFVAGVAASRWAPRPRVRSYLQHFAAGAVFSAASLDVAPDLVHGSAPLPVALGFSIGAALMLAIRVWAGDADGPSGGLSSRTIAVVGIDIAIDGLLIGLLLGANERTGMLVAAALGVELLAVGLALGASGARRGRATMTTIAVLALLPWAGSIIGQRAANLVSASALDALLAFALAALLYLATEELLVEAHEVPETTFATATFFLGFLVLMLLDLTAAG